jgi:elongation factor Ts
MAISASMVKELRERTGLGMMECKSALTEAGGDIELAIENLRKSGQAKAAKKAGRVASEGAVLARIADGMGVLLEINSETDFVARDANFLQFADRVVSRALELRVVQVEDLLNVSIEKIGGVTIEEARQALILKIGENIQVRRITGVEAPVLGAYVHNGNIGVLVGLVGGSEELARDIAMHIAASNPMVVSSQDVPAAVLQKEREIYLAQVQDSGKPKEIMEKMVEGRVRKFLGEVSLIEQPFVKNPDIKVADLLKTAGATVQQFVRFEVGEGIEKETVDFAKEVMAQIK